MPLARFEHLEPAKRARFLAIATAEFGARGYAEASLNDILAASGFGKSSYYYYFADKEDLFATVVEDIYRALDTQLAPTSLAVASASEFWAAIEQQQLAWLKAILQTPHAVGVLRAAQILRNAGAANAAVTARVTAQLRANIVAGRARGFVRTDLDVEVLVAVAEAADAALDVTLYAATGQPSPARLRAHARLALDTARRLLAPATP